MDHEQTDTHYSPLDVRAIIDGAEVLLDDGRYRVLALKTAPAAAWWARDTRWCTANPGWFQTHQGHGELIYIEDRKSRGRWQLQLWRCEFRNWRNRRVDPIGFAARHPAVMRALDDRLRRDLRARFFFGLVQSGQIFEHSLNVSSVRLKSLPNGLRIRDDLDVSFTGIKQLPEALRIGGHLYVSDDPMPAMPQDYRLRGHRFIRSRRLMHLA